MRMYLVSLRKKAHMTQHDVACALGITRQYYQQIESGQRQPKLELLLASKLTNILQTPLDEFLVKETEWQIHRESILRAQTPQATKKDN